MAASTPDSVPESNRDGEGGSRQQREQREHERRRDPQARLKASTLDTLPRTSTMLRSPPR